MSPPNYGPNESIDFIDQKMNDSLMSIGFQTAGNKFATTTSSFAGGFYGGNKFHSSKANWNPHNSIIRDSSLIRSSKMRLESADAYVEDQLYGAYNQMRYQPKSRRQQPNIRIL